MSMLEAVESCEWSTHDSTDPNAAWLAFRQQLETLCDRFVPLKRAAASLRRPPWFDRELRRELNARRRAWNTYRASGSEEDYRRYKIHRNKCNTLKKVKRRDYEAKLLSTLKHEPKRAYSYINRRLRKSDELPTLLDDDGNVIEGDLPRATLLARFYSSVFSDGPPVLPYEPGPVTAPECTEQDVLILLRNLDTHKAPGPDGIHPLILQRLAPVIAAPLASLFSLSLREGIVPDDWKVAVVKPFFKGGNKHEPANYRPVSLTSVVCKLMEKWIKKLIREHMEQHNLLTAAQHGFVKGRSCATNLVQAQETWQCTIDGGHPIDAVFVDFSKAFDRVDHGMLVKTLENYGFQQPLVRWVSNFLEGRRFQVRVNGTHSQPFVAKSGVPQGTVLGPVLFNVYVNRIPQELMSPCLMFADDLKIWRSIQDMTDPTRLQDDLDRLLRLSEELHLPINFTKCQHLTVGKQDGLRRYSIAGHIVPQETTVRDLGIWIRSDGRTIDQTTRVTAKGKRMLWALRRTFSTWSADAVPKLFATFVRPILEYGAPAYFPHTRSECVQLERIQRLATRLIPGLRELTYIDRCLDLNMYTLEYRRTRMDLIFTFKVVCLQQFPGLLPFFKLSRGRNTRGHPFKLEKIRRHRISTVSSLSTRVLNLWNSLPTRVVSVTTVEAFKLALDTHLWTNDDTWKCEPTPGAPYPRFPRPLHLR